jgi:hypothetical protein
MHRLSLTLLLVLSPLCSALQAEESTLASPAATHIASQPNATQRIHELEAELGAAVQQRDELAGQLSSGLAERETAQVARLRQENQKLKLQLREALAKQQQSLFTETQTWYLAGAATALLGAAIGALLRGNRRRRQWLN